MALTSLMVGVLLYVVILIFFNERGQKTIQEACCYCAEAAWIFFLAPSGLWVAYLMYTNSVGGINWPVAFWVLGYYLLPSVLLWFAGDAQDSFSILDIPALASIWLPLVLHWWPERKHGAHYDKPLILISVTVIAMLFWVGLRKIKATKVRFSLETGDIKMVTTTLAWLMPTLLACALATHFISPEIFLANWAHFHILGFILKIALIFFYTALIEEFFFRGIIQNMLEKNFGKNAGTLLAASFIFGLGHLSHATRSWNPHTWDWTYLGLAIIAGLGYGKIFRNASSIAYPMLAHAIIDATWSLWKMRT
jgi:membrane protease YdiL (CAAX protease family)